MVASNSFMNMFAQSPVRPLQQHIEKAHNCALQLIPFFEAVLAEDWAQAEKIQQQIAQLEHEADELKRHLRQHLPKSLFMPVARTTLLDLLQMQDQIANKAKDIAGIMLGRQMQIPASMAQSMLEFIQSALSVTSQAVDTLNELDELVVTGFRGREAEVVEKMIVRLATLESDTDNREKQLRLMLFKLEKELPPVDVMFLYKVIDWIGELADRAEQVGSRFQLLLSR
ncbi:MAG: putative phosphate transport protein (TIGR00153 family) [Motiliproteus sp.]|jgi:predicted phosphate transport protein (TIGR00153 family)